MQNEHEAKPCIDRTRHKLKSSIIPFWDNIIEIYTDCRDDQKHLVIPEIVSLLERLKVLSGRLDGDI